MINLAIAIAVGVGSYVLFGFLFGGGDFNPYYGIIPGIGALMGAYFYLARRTFQEVQVIFQSAQAQLQNKKIDRAIDTIKTAYPLAQKQFLLAGQIDGQIGSILFMSKRFDEAESYLKKAFKRNWTPQAMLGVLYYKKNKDEQMRAVFEEAVKVNKKQALLWNVYAYCLWKRKKKEDAVGVLNRALEHVPNDEKTKQNLKSLQNNKKMKMRGWNMLWYQFHLDSPPAQKQQMRFKR